MRQTLAGRLVTGLRWLAVLAVLVASAEISARADDWVTWRASLLGEYSNEGLLTLDSLGYRGRPGYRFEKWGMNNAGFRGPDIAPLARPGTTRVAVLGASETFGLYEAEGFEYPARMQAVLDSLTPGRFEVVNVSLPGLSLSTMVPYYERVVSLYHPDVVMIYPSPSFYLEVTPLPLAQPVHTPTPASATQREEREDRLVFEARLGRKTRDVIKGLVPGEVVTAYREWRLGRVRAGHEPDWVWTSVPMDRMAVLEQHLKRLVTTIQAGGAQPILLTHTNRFVGAASIRRDERRHLINLMSVYYPRATPHIMVAVDSVANDIIRSVARKLGAGVVEVEGRIPPTGEHFADYAHFTDVGADAMARILTASLLDLGPGQGTVAPTCSDGMDRGRARRLALTRLISGIS